MAKNENHGFINFLKENGLIVGFVVAIFGFGVTYANILNEIKDIKSIMQFYKVELDKQKSAIFDQQRLNLYSLGKKCGIAEKMFNEIKEKQKIDAINNDFVTPRYNFPSEHRHLEKPFALDQRKNNKLDKKKSEKNQKRNVTHKLKLIASD